MSETKIEFDLTGNPKGNLVDLFDDLKKPADPAAPVMDKGGQAEQDGQTPAGNEAAASQQEPQPEPTLVPTCLQLCSNRAKIFTT